MNNRKFFKTRIVIEVLSEEEIPPGMSVEQIAYEARYGGYSMRNVEEKSTELNGKEMAVALMEQGSDPEFFGLTRDGEDTE